MVTGWWDLFAPGQLRDYTAIRAAGGAARIIVGPWLHGEPGEMKAIAQHDTAWLDHHLNGGPLPPGAPVRVFLQQAGRWLDFADWPPPAAVNTPYYLRVSGALRLDAEPGDAPPHTFVYDPADPTPSKGGPLLQPPGKQVDNAEIELRPDVLTFTTDPLAADLDLVGPVTARIFVRTGRQYADVFVRVCDVDDRGVSRNVVDGIRRLSPQTVPAADVEAGDDGVLAVAVELYPDRLPGAGRAPDPGAGQRGLVPAVCPQLRHRRGVRRGHQGAALPVRDLPRFPAPFARPAPGAAQLAVAGAGQSGPPGGPVTAGPRARAGLRSALRLGIVAAGLEQLPGEEIGLIERGGRYPVLGAHVTRPVLMGADNSLRRDAVRALQGK